MQQQLSIKEVSSKGAQAKEDVDAGHEVFSFEEKMLWALTVFLLIFGML